MVSRGNRLLVKNQIICHPHKNLQDVQDLENLTKIGLFFFSCCFFLFTGLTLHTHTHTHTHIDLLDVRELKTIYHYQISASTPQTLSCNILNETEGFHDSKVSLNIIIIAYNFLRKNSQEAKGICFFSNHKPFNSCCAVLGALLCTFQNAKLRVLSTQFQIQS